MSAPALALENGDFAAGLSGWTIVERGGTSGAAGTAAAVAGGAQLTEGASFTVSLEQSFTIPTSAATLRFAVTPTFDTAATGIPDAVEVALLGADGRSVLPTWKNGTTAAFGIDERALLRLGSASTATPTGASLAVALDVSTLAVGTPVKLVFTLVGGDVDTSSTVVIGGVSFDLSNRPPVANAGEDRTIECAAGTTLTAASLDPDGDPLTHVWTTEAGEPVGSGVSVAVNPPPGLHRYRLTSTDEAGASNSVLVAVTVVDTTGPSLPSLPVLVALDAGESCTASLPDLLVGVSATDLCGSASVAQSVAAGTTFAPGDHLVTLTATDAANNTSSHVVTVRVSDRIAPTITSVEAPASVPAEATCDAAIPALIVIATDNCTPPESLTFEQGVAAGTRFGLGTQVVGVTASDVAGNTSSPSEATFDVVDVTPPTASFTAGAALPATSAQCTASLPDLRAQVTATDNCAAAGAPVVTQVTAVGTSLGLGAVDVAFTIVDSAGNLVALTGSVSVIDAAPPSIAELADVSVIADATCSGAVPTLAASASDACGQVTITQSVPVGTALTFGAPTSVVVTARDAAGAETSETVLVTLVDETPPTATFAAPAALSADDATCTAGAPDLRAQVSAQDNCAAPVVSQVTALGTPLSLGENDVAFTVTDGAGNPLALTGQVTVIDATPPTLSPLANVDVVADSACTGAIPALAGSGTDACGAVTLSQSVPAGTSLTFGAPVSVQVTARDGAGLEASRTVTVTLVDKTPPTLSAAAEATVVADDLCKGALPDLTVGATATDNCPGTLTLSQATAEGTPIDVGAPLSATLAATDASGNTAERSVEVTAQDETAPTITLPATVDVDVFSGCAGDVPDLAMVATIADGCTAPGALTVLQDVAIGSALAVDESKVITVRVRDIAGNEGVASTVVVGKDAGTPTLTLPEVTQVDAGDNCSGVIGKLIPDALDECSTVTVVQSLPEDTVLVFGEDASVTVTVTDGGGNAISASTTVRLVDRLPPSIVPAAAAVPIAADATCAAVTPDLAQGAVVTDNCPLPQGITANSDLAVGTPLVLDQPLSGELTAVDASGNLGVAPVTVASVDETPPVITPVEPANVTADAACAGVVPAFTPVVSDNCDPAPTLEQQPAAGAALTLSAAQDVVLTARDAAGREATLATSATLRDLTPPTASVVGLADVVVDGACASAMPSLEAHVTLSLADNCGDAAITGQSPSDGAALTLGVNDVSVSLVDGAGNVVQITGTVTAVDDTAPTLSAIADGDVDADATCAGVVPDLTSGATDNCAGTTVAQVPPAGTALVFGAPTVVTVTATDAAGKTASQQATWSLRDVTPPTITLSQTSFIVAADAACQGFLPDLATLATATDNCVGAVTWSQNPEIGSFLTLETVKDATLTATDAAGNAAAETVAVTLGNAEGACGDQPDQPDEAPDVQDQPAEPSDSDVGTGDTSSGDLGPATGDVISSDDLGEQPTPPDAGRVTGATEDGCGCRQSGERPMAPGAALIIVLLGLAWGRRRLRRR
ncbi:MAG: hypothetical protein IV100_00470 [Myxococcales bacterium]|nr:hypothetical protein [Myxococcales bacterium]